jgi:hypothetical protein
MTERWDYALDQLRRVTALSSRIRSRTVPGSAEHELSEVVHDLAEAVFVMADECHRAAICEHASPDVQLPRD